MRVEVIVNRDSKRHHGLSERIWEKFPEIGGIEEYKISFNQTRYSFELGAVTKEKMQEFLASEGLIGFFSD